jgi:DNA polymerase-3 subunit epsilon
LPQGKLAAFDIESTCIRGASCRVVSAALVELRGGGLALETLHYAVEPPDGPAGESALIHGVTGSHSARVDSLNQLLTRAASYTLIVYGRHDVNLLLQEAEKRRLPIRRVCFIDILNLLLSNPLRKYQAIQEGGYPLEKAVREMLHLELPERRFHDPVTDAVYTGLLYLKMVRMGYQPKVECTSKRQGIVSLLSSLLWGRKRPA